MKKQSLYLECYSGISGDMTVGALLDLGADQEVLLNGLKSLNVDGYKIEITRKLRNSIDACDFNVILEKDNHDHDMDYLFGHEKAVQPANAVTSKSYKLKRPAQAHNTGSLKLHGNAQVHDHNLEHTHGHPHSHSISTPHLHYGHHEHRNLQDIYSILDASSITDNAKAIAKRIFLIIAEAESKAHGKSLEEVHFHEVGATDSIVDITAAAICLDNLNISEVYVSELYEGRGQITCQHGVLPIPVPAVVNISSKYSLKLHLTQVKGELVTPTGAAIAAAIRTKEELPSNFTISRIGLGTGKRAYEQTSFLRAMLIEDTETVLPDTIPDTVWVLEANLDDCSGEVLGHTMDILLKGGAKDVYYTPIYMKKNRPAYLLGVICAEKDIPAVEELIFTHTTTIGIRRQEMKRTTLNRSFTTLQTPYGEATVKLCRYSDKTFCYPEGDSIRSLSLSSGLDYTTLYSLVQTLALKL